MQSGRARATAAVRREARRRRRLLGMSTPDDADATDLLADRVVGPHELNARSFGSRRVAP